MNYTHKMIFDATDHIGKQLKLGGYETDLLSAVKPYLDLSAVPVVVDVGAHYGNFAVFCCMASPDSDVHAFEPNPDTFGYLEENAWRYGFDAYNFAVSDEFPSCSVVPGPNGNSGMSKVVEGGKIPCVYLDDMFEDEPVDILKIDVEGHEVAVLRTAALMLKNHRPVVICEAQDQEAFDAIDNHLADYGYTCTGKRYCATPTYIWEPPVL